MMTRTSVVLAAAALLSIGMTVSSQVKPDTLRYEPFVWESRPPADCPFPQSKEFKGIKLLGAKSGFHVADTWYPTWASDDRLYSPYTDGSCPRLDGSTEHSWSGGEQAVT